MRVAFRSRCSKDGLRLSRSTQATIVGQARNGQVERAVCKRQERSQQQARISRGGLGYFDVHQLC